MKKRVEILDTTLRDGSYTIGYQFSLQDNVLISSGLERAGVNFIEIGHGTGLGTSRIDNNYQAYSDKQYMQCVRDALDTSQYGFFFIPNIGNSDDIQMLADHGGGFIRIGVSIENYHSAKKYIELAKKLKIKVWINLMKSYIYSTEQFSEFSNVCFNDGVEGLYLVDSAGGMLPNTVAQYIETASIKLDKNDANDFSLGFHGHENISMGVACALAAVQSGASIIDGSLLGIGRSIGNSPIETLGMVLQKAGYSSTIDPWALSDLANKTVKPYLENRWRHSSEEQALGFKEIHSSFLKDIEQFANEENIKLRDLILALPKDASRQINSEILQQALETSQKATKKDDTQIQINSQDMLTKEISLISISINEYLNNLLSLAERTNRKSVLLLTTIWNKKIINKFLIKKIKSSQGFEIGALDLPIDVNHINLDTSLLKRVDYLIYDTDFSNNQIIQDLIQSVDMNKVFKYSDKNTVFNHIGRYISVLATKNHSIDPTVHIISKDHFRDKLGSSIESYGLQNINDPNHASYHILLSVDDEHPYQIHQYKKLKYVVDIRSQILNDADVEYALKNNIDLVAIDFEAAIISEVVAIISNYENVSLQSGDVYIQDLRLVAKGKWGNKGDIIVDKVPMPSYILGISDGLGGFKEEHSNQDSSNINKIITHMINC